MLFRVRAYFSPDQLAGLASDVVWAFGLKDPSGSPLVLRPRALVPALARALGGLRPVARAPSIGEIVERLRGLDPKSPPRVRRKLVRELVELVAQGTHGRAKRQERKRILGDIVLLFALEPTLLGQAAVAPTLDARLEAIDCAVTKILGGLTPRTRAIPGSACPSPFVLMAHPPPARRHTVGCWSDS